MQNSETETTNPPPLDERMGLPSASNWHRYELCSGSYQLSQEAKKLGQEANKTSHYAESGLRVHRALEGQQVDDLTEEEADIAEKLIKSAQEEIERIFGDRAKYANIKREQRLWIRYKGSKAASGRADLIAVVNQTALIIDYKPSWTKPEPAALNAQLRLLAVALAVENPFLAQVIVQIHAPYGVSEHQYGKAELRDAWESIIKTISAINAPAASFSPSITACRYCPALNICQAARDVAGKVAKLQTSVLPDGERASEILDECELVVALISSIREHYYGQLLSPGYKIPNWGLAPGRKVRELTSMALAKERLGAEIDINQIDGLASYSVPALEKLVAKRFAIPAKEASVKLAELLGDCLNIKQEKDVLKRTGPITKKL
jgi:hypothetical protein